MDNQDKMYLALAAPCGLAALLTGVATSVAMTVRDIPLMSDGGRSPLAGTPELIATLGALATAGLMAWQAWRARQWIRGEAATCSSCGCLLSEARQRRWSVCRRCLGCGKYTQERS